MTTVKVPQFMSTDLSIYPHPEQGPRDDDQFNMVIGEPEFAPVAFIPEARTGQEVLSMAVGASVEVVDIVSPRTEALAADNTRHLTVVRTTVEDCYAETAIAEAPIAPAIAVTAPELVVDTTVERKETAPKFKLRAATEQDIDAIVDVDMKSFSAVYAGYDQDPETLRAELTETFRGRFEKVGGGWMPVLEKDGEIVGFMTCCPTNKTPDEFKSWEDTTDNGTLENTYDPDGKNIYVVTLSVLPEGSAGKDMLFADQIGKMMREGYECGFFESRMPGMRSWLNRQMKKSGREIDDLSTEEKDAFAEQYFNLKSVVGGKEVRYDRLLRLYERVGCNCIKMVPDAYQDEPSMNYGVVCVYDGQELFDGSVLPFKLPQNRLTRWAAGGLMQLAARSPKATNKFFN
ncbi:MAG: family N-acetyltransferase [Candidatus Saccharibacteria bacterium]|nr:family N-acetyltransferase [Candidatus Saccharibacteria bacterium]